MEIKEQIEDYFDLLKMKHTWNVQNESFELVFTERKDEQPATPSPSDEEGYFKYTITVRPTEKWVQIYCDIYPLANIPDDKRQNVFLEILKMNRKYAEVCFDFNAKTNSIGVSEELLNQGLNFDGFRTEFLAVPWAVKRFWVEIAKPFNLE